MPGPSHKELDVDYSDFDYGDPIARWFIEEAWKIVDTGDLVKAISERLCEAGIPLYRMSFLRLELHPDLLGRAWFWRRGQPMSDAVAERSVINTSDYRDNPLPLVFAKGKTIRVHLEDLSDGDISYPILKQFKAEGVTDYVALPVVYADGHNDALTVASDKPGGFSFAELDRMFALQRLFARLVENQSLRVLAVNLLDIYVGREAGAQILDGHIMRGDSESLHAVIWLCDMRGFTPLSDQLPREQLIELLNEYFDCMATPVRERGGEIIKFVGDAMLATFRVDREAELAAVSAAAVDAAEAALKAMDDNNRDRLEAGKPVADVGIAIHEGEVMFGNIGAAGRLDFTVIGPAVNRVARVGNLCRELGQRLLLTGEVARHVPGRGRSMGSFELRGTDRPHEIFAVTA